MQNLAIFSLCLLLASCGIYKSNFDCPAGRGVGCARVGEVLDMIVERDDGEDLFIKDRGTQMPIKLVEGHNGELIQEEGGESQRHSRKKKKPKLQLIQGSNGELILEEDEAEVPLTRGKIKEPCLHLVEGREGGLVLEEEGQAQIRSKKREPKLQLIRGNNGELVLVDEKIAKGD